jgi:hypothetical protein
MLEKFATELSCIPGVCDTLSYSSTRCDASCGELNRVTVNFMCKRTSMFFWSADVNTENYIGRTYAEMERCICVCALDDPAPVR